MLTVSENPLVSVVVPVYRCEDTIAACIRSVQAQQGVTWELLPVLDGEFDRSGEICRAMAAEDDRITVIAKKNEGVSVARNTGIERARGEYICFVDGDDSLTPDALLTLTDLAARHEADIAVGGYYLDDLTGSVPQSFFTFDGERVISQAERPELIANCLICRGFGNPAGATNVGVPWAKVYRRDFLLREGLRFVPGLKRMQDAIFNLSAFRQAGMVAVSSQPVYHYCRHTAASTTAYRPDFYDTARFILSEAEKFQRTAQLPDFDRVLEAKAIALMIETLHLQYLPEACSMELREKLRSLSRQLGQEPFRTAFRRSATNPNLNKKQRIIAGMFRFRLLRPLYTYYDKNARAARERLIRAGKEGES